jgi:hypothetical protein
MIVFGFLLLGVGPAAVDPIFAGASGLGESVLENQYATLATATLTVAAVFLGAVGLIFFAKQRSPDRRSNSRSQPQESALAAQRPLTSEDFPVSAKGEKLVTQEGKQVADTESRILAEDIAGRLNENELAGKCEIEM